DITEVELYGASSVHSRHGKQSVGRRKTENTPGLPRESAAGGPAADEFECPALQVHRAVIVKPRLNLHGSPVRPERPRVHNLGGSRTKRDQRHITDKIPHST